MIINLLARKPVRAAAITLSQIVACLFASSCTSPDSPTPSDAVTVVRLRSDAGDPVGLGGTYEYTLANSEVQVERTGYWLSMEVSGDEMWGVYLQPPPALGRLAPGVYTNATSDFAPGLPRLMVATRQHRCQSATGQFAIQSVGYAPDSVITSIDATFEQRCQGATGMLSGTIHWRRDDPTKPPGPIVPVPSNLWRPPAGATPATGNYLYIESDPADLVGDGTTKLYTGFSSENVMAIDGIGLGGVGPWSGSLRPRRFTNPTVGYWAGLSQSVSYSNPTKGTIEWRWSGRSCTLRFKGTTGWFAIDAISIRSNGTVDVLDARFEQRCDDAAGALRGAIHVAP